MEESRGKEKWLISEHKSLALLPLFSWAMSQVISLFEGTISGRKALVGFVIAAIFSLIWYTVSRSVVNYRKSMPK